MNDKSLLGYRFEQFSLLLDQRVLLRNGARTRLTCRQFNTLLLLLHNAPRPVTREQFASSVWRKTTVEDSNLTVTIRALRKILGDSAGESRYIETIPKEGYRFIPTVTTILGEHASSVLRCVGAADAAIPQPQGAHHSTAPSQVAVDDGAEARRTTGGPSVGKRAAEGPDTGANPLKARAAGRRSMLPIGSCVPAPLVSLIGRDREVKGLSTMLVRQRLVTLVGAGGSGKTELSQQIASGLAEHFTDGVVFVSLASITDPGLLGSAIVQSLGIRESGTQSLSDTLATSLRRKKLLLLLDNFEHLISAAEFVVWLLRMCPRLTVLVTSRTPLRVSGEHVYPVEPLPLPDLKKRPTRKALENCPSVALFIERARAASGDFEFTADNAGP
jgi:DNA-binding winged helix-turn-helix (wHTH) protein